MHVTCLVAILLGFVGGHRLHVYDSLYTAARTHEIVHDASSRARRRLGIWASADMPLKKQQDEIVGPAASDDEVKRVASTTIPTRHGPLNLTAFQSSIGDILVAITNISDGLRVPVRVHDACLTGEVFGSLKCDCGPQLQLALQEQRRLQRGVIIYMPQEGRGIGLANKIAAYHLQESQGLDSVDANLALGFPPDCRVYNPIKEILDNLEIKSIMLMTNNPLKVEQLLSCGVNVEGVTPLVCKQIGPERQYLETMRTRMGHDLPDLPI